jgi:hypothetical protein
LRRRKAGIDRAFKIAIGESDFGRWQAATRRRSTING